MDACHRAQFGPASSSPFRTRRTFPPKREYRRGATVPWLENKIENLTRLSFASGTLHAVRFPSMWEGSPTSTNNSHPLCVCCRLPQPAHRDHLDVPSPVCKACAFHQGEQPDKRLKCAESHEKMLRERLDACRRSEEDTRVQAAMDRAVAKERVSSALSSRGRLASRIVAAAEKGGYHRCPAIMIANESDVRDWARRDADMRATTRYYDDEEIA